MGPVVVLPALTRVRLLLVVLLPLSQVVMETRQLTARQARLLAPLTAQAAAVVVVVQITQAPATRVALADSPLAVAVEVARLALLRAVA